MRKKKKEKNVKFLKNKIEIYWHPQIIVNIIRRTEVLLGTQRVFVVLPIKLSCQQIKKETIQELVQKWARS